MAKDASDGLEKSALLLLTLGGDEAAEVLKHLSPVKCRSWAPAWPR